jgi:hypothetical protein
MPLRQLARRPRRPMGTVLRLRCRRRTRRKASWIRPRADTRRPMISPWRLSSQRGVRVLSRSGVIHWGRTQLPPYRHPSGARACTLTRRLRVMPQHLACRVRPPATRRRDLRADARLLTRASLRTFPSQPSHAPHPDRAIRVCRRHPSRVHMVSHRSPHRRLRPLIRCLFQGRRLPARSKRASPSLSPRRVSIPMPL